MSSNGPYMFFSNTGTLGTKLTTNPSDQTFPWSIDISGNIIGSNIQYKNEVLIPNIVTQSTYNIDQNTNKLTLMSATSNMTVNLTDQPTLNSIFEFRVTTKKNTTFQTVGVVHILDLNNDDVPSIGPSDLNYYSFYYTNYNSMKTYILLDKR
jgi:hypothetical protein